MANILVVEDEAIVALATKFTLTNMGHTTVAVVSKGEHALEEMGKHPVDLILMDIKLKGEMDGVEAAEKIRKISSVPILFLTGNSDNITKELTKNITNSCTLAKPSTTEDMQEAINKMLHLS